MTTDRSSQLWICRVVLATLLASISGTQRATDPFTDSGRASLLPACREVVASLDVEHIEQLRDAVQQLSEAFSVKHAPPATPSSWPSGANASTPHATEPQTPPPLDLDAASQALAVLLQQVRESRAGLKGVTDAQLRACVSGRLRPHRTHERPRVSFMLQYFRGHSAAVPRFLEHLASCQPHFLTELIVNVDDPADHALWVAAAAETGGLVVPVLSTNIHEIRAYNRMLSISRGQYIIYLQDDSPPAGNCSWLPPLVKAFERWPDIGVFGLRSFQFCCCALTHNDNRQNWFLDPGTGEGMHFAQRVDMAPVAFRREALESLGGMDETLSDPGMCGISSDWHYSHTMWLAGWKVAYWQHLKMGSSGTPGSTHRSGGATHRCWTRQMTIVAQTMQVKMARRLEDEMCALARALNLADLNLADAAQCPYKHTNCTL